jgi:hypothetical protein
VSWSSRPSRFSLPASPDASKIRFPDQNRAGLSFPRQERWLVFLRSQFAAQLTGPASRSDVRESQHGKVRRRSFLRFLTAGYFFWL